MAPVGPNYFDRLLMIAFACGRCPGVNKTGSGDDDPTLIDQVAA